MSFRITFLIAAVRNRSANVLRTVTAVAGMFVFAAIANATSITVNNFSFEVDNGGGNPAIVPTGWSFSGGGGSFVRNGDGFTGQTGPQDASAYGTSSLLYQSSITTFLANTIYTLSVDVSGGIQPGGVGSWSILSGPTNIVAVTSGDTAFPDDDTFYTQTLSINTALAPSLVGTSLGIGLGSTAAAQFAFDNVRLDAVTVPEPTSIGLCGIGMLGLAPSVARRAKRLI